MDADVRGSGQHNALPFEFRALEIEDQTNVQSWYAKVVHHLAAFVRGDPFDHLRIHDYTVSNDEVGNICSDFNALVHDREGWLLNVRDLPQAELDDERPLVWLLVKPVAEAVQNIHGRSDERIRQVCMRGA